MLDGDGDWRRKDADENEEAGRGEERFAVGALMHGEESRWTGRNDWRVAREGDGQVEGVRQWHL